MKVQADVITAIVNEDGSEYEIALEQQEDGQYKVISRGVLKKKQALCFSDQVNRNVDGLRRTACVV